MTALPTVLPNGFLIIFEGIDGAGKSTQLSMARDALAAENWPLHTTRALGGTPIGEALREVMLSPAERPAETDLHMSLAIQAALIEALQTERQEGKLILLDRGPLSQLAYEVYGGQFDAAVGWPYVEAGMQQLKPELTLIYEADPAQALTRAQAASPQADYFENKPLSFFKRVAAGYREAARHYADRVVVIPADQQVEAVHVQTMTAIREALTAAA